MTSAAFARFECLNTGFLHALHGLPNTGVNHAGVFGRWGRFLGFRNRHDGSGGPMDRWPSLQDFDLGVSRSPRTWCQVQFFHNIFMTENTSEKDRQQS
jgi:hypothetical protein